MNNKFSKIKNIKILLLSVLLASLGALHFFGTKSIFTTLEENHSLEADVLILEDKQKQLQAIKQDVQSVLSDFTFLQSSFIKKEEMPDFMQFFENTLENTGVNISVSSVTSNPLEGGVSTKEEVTIQFSLNGTKDQIETCLKLLEVFPFKTNIKNISLGLENSTNAKTENNTNKEKSGPWTANITLTVIKNK